MSYDIYIYEDLIGNKVIKTDLHHLQGGTYRVGGSDEAHLNITYNYSPFYYRIFGELGIRWIYGKKVIDTLPGLLKGIQELQKECETFDTSTIPKRFVNPDEGVKGKEAIYEEWDPEYYWCPTPKNAMKALQQLVALAALALEGYWDGD